MLASKKPCLEFLDEDEPRDVHGVCQSAGVWETPESVASNRSRVAAAAERLISSRSNKSHE